MYKATKLTIQLSQEQAELFNAYADRLGKNQAKSLLVSGGFKEIKKHDDLLKREIKNLALSSELAQSRLNNMIYQGFEPLTSQGERILSIRGEFASLLIIFLTKLA